MKQLTLLRHAKSSGDNPGLDDVDRVLNDRGRKTAPLIGAYMEENALTPDCILCSSAVRTRQTLDLILPFLGGAAQTSFSKRLYLASPGDMLKQIKTVSDDFEHILVIAHNPGTHMLALDLIDPAHSNIKLVTQLAGKFPTAALAHFQFEVSTWQKLALGGGALVAFATPQSL